MGEISTREESINFCPHGLSPAECEACLFAQPTWETIKKLQSESEFKRSSETDANCTIKIEGKKYTIETIESGEDPKLSDVQKLFEDTFGKEEVDPEEILRGAVDGTTCWGTPEMTKYRIVNVRNEKGELASTFAGGQLDLRDELGQPTGEAVYFVGYAVTNKKMRQKGLAKEAYISALIDATKEAQSQGRKLKFAVGECTYTSEKFWNSVGWKRIYSEDKEKEFKEVEYTQPALDFDEDTGEIAEGAGEAPEHLMIDNFTRGNLSKEDLKKSYMAFMSYNVDWPPEAFNNPEAHEKQKGYVNSVETRFVDDLNSRGENLVLLSAKERAAAKKAGVKISESNDANHGDAGKEDF